MGCVSPFLNSSSKKVLSLLFTVASPDLLWKVESPVYSAIIVMFSSTQSRSNGET